MRKVRSVAAQAPGTNVLPVPPRPGRGGRASACIAVIALSMSGRTEAHEVPLWTSAPRACPTDSLSHSGQRCATVIVDRNALDLSGAELELALPDGTTVVASLVKTRPGIRQHLIWHGTVKGAKSSGVTFSAVGNVVVGTIAFDGKIYRLRSIGRGEQIVEQLDRQQILPGGNPVGVSPSGTGEDGGSANSDDDGVTECMPVATQCLTDDPYRIDVMVLYTESARIAADGEDPMTAWINLNVFETNRSYVNSNAKQHVRIVQSKEIAYTEASASIDLSALTRKNDTNLNLAHQWRDDHDADIVVLVTHSSTPTTSGLANPMQYFHVGANPLEPFEPLAFAVVEAAGFLAPEYAFAHELGHVMGTQHNLPAIEGALRDSSYGHVDESPGDGCTQWMTLMSERHPAIQGRSPICLDCERIPYWSTADPAMKYCSKFMGNGEADNRRTLDCTASFVSGFRCSESARTDVWLKDTWEDTGAEPDPLTAAQEMWKSPYLWNRTAPDSAPIYQFQHRHQNPVAGRTNYLYAKLHNGGSETSGKLELWVANASTNLSWPASFSQIPIPPNEIELASRSTRILEYAWTPPSKGHYCIVARWVSSTDGMTTPETAFLDSNVRGNNNIAWRNVNVVSFLNARAHTTSILVRNSGENPASFTLEVKPSDRNPERSFFRIGGASLQLDGALMRAWEAGRFRSSGIRRGRRGIRVTDAMGVKLEGLVLQPGVQGQLDITFYRPSVKIGREVYLVDVIQTLMDGRDSKIVGGVTYAIEAGDRP